MCNCGCGSSGSCIIDLTGIGQKGDTGATGGYGGWSSLWNFSSTTTTGTTAGQLRLNNATYGSVTSIYVNTTNANSIDVSNFLASFTNGTYYGKIRIFKESDNTKFWEGSITNVSVSGSEYTLTVTYTLANSTFAASDKVVLTFTPNGLGAKPIIYSYLGLMSDATTGSWISPGADASFTIPAGTLATDGDYLEVIVRGVMSGSGSPTILDGIRAKINSTAVGSSDTLYRGIVGNELLHHSGSQGRYYDLRLQCERVDATSLQVYYTAVLDSTISISSTTTFSGTSVNNLNTNTNTLEFEVYQGGVSGDTVTIEDIKAIKYLQ